MKLYSGVIVVCCVVSSLISGCQSRIPKTKSAVVSDNSNVRATKGEVNPITDIDLFKHRENFFNLNGMTLEFFPKSDGFEYHKSPLSFTSELGEVLGYASASSWDGRGWKAALPFEMNYGGKKFKEMFINLNGNISFGSSESDLWQQRNPWASGGMLSMASAISSRSRIGLEKMIAVFWSENTQKNSKVYFNTFSDHVVVTWDVLRPEAGHLYYTPLGRNLFQARLYSSGAIHFSYKEVNEKDGIVGLFTGGPIPAVSLDQYFPSESNVVDRRLKIDEVEVAESGQMIRFDFKANAPLNFTSADNVTYRLSLSAGKKSCVMALYYTHGKQNIYGDCTNPPRLFTYELKGKNLTFWVPKGWLAGNQEVNWWLENFDGVANEPVFTIGRPEARHFTMKNPQPSGIHFSEISKGLLPFDTFEVFHYTPFMKLFGIFVPMVYKRYEASDDFAIFFTDFRMDEIYGGGEASGPINVKIEGIGNSAMYPIDGTQWGSSKIQTVVTPAYLGQPQFNKKVSDEYRSYDHYGWTIGWLSHEISHRWLAGIKHKDSVTGEETDLTDESCHCHWDWRLSMPSLAKVSSRFNPDGYEESSPMGGNIWVEKSEGIAELIDKPYVVPFGFSPLDLYAMGLISANEVPDMIYHKDAKVISGREHKYTKAVISTKGIIAKEGKRIPEVAHSQKEFSLGVYLIHLPDKKPDSQFIQQALEIRRELVNYFDKATDGRMKLK